MRNYQSHRSKIAPAHILPLLSRLWFFPSSSNIPVRDSSPITIPVAIQREKKAGAEKCTHVDGVCHPSECISARFLRDGAARDKMTQKFSSRKLSWRKTCCPQLKERKRKEVAMFLWRSILIRDSYRWRSIMNLSSSNNRRLSRREPSILNKLKLKTRLSIKRSMKSKWQQLNQKAADK